jgi:hypothetical protein
MISDKNGRIIQVGDDLNVPLDVFTNGMVILDENKQLALELKYDHKVIALNDLHYNLINSLVVLEKEKHYYGKK